MQDRTKRLVVPFSKRKWDITSDTFGLHRKLWPLPNAPKAPANLTNCYFVQDGVIVAVDYFCNIRVAPKLEERLDFLYLNGYQELAVPLLNVAIPDPPPWA